ncbi:protein phosphatase 2C domain-containing protein [Brevundimonas sp. WCHBH090558]|uniref:PP2C family serine/threonine-protein phosphatase n=1 Tax=Brevundimonas huaxiensis TaxID=2725493 RepID=UPI001624E170|nr:PP2C family serine/threonine-protein phosphatase [Brevundimonas huaxiensis]MBC1183766.1 protein phosphatase 2C domain-containing protein [Brevundimonas huaxiensis]
MSAWRWAAASTIGTSHLRTGAPRQDAYGVRRTGNGRICAVVSDGAGSATYGGPGAWIVCREFLAQAQSWSTNSPGLPEDQIISDWIDAIRDRISRAAERRASAPRQFAATLAAVFATDSEALVIQVGDSVVAGRADGSWTVPLWPESGEYASTTYFVTDSPSPRLNLAREAVSFDGFALFSDGIETIALDHSEQQAHRPFLDPMIKAIDNAPGSGRLAPLSGHLASYLDSDRVNDRTDDDKTLILLSRRP